MAFSSTFRQFSRIKIKIFFYLIFARTEINFIFNSVKNILFILIESKTFIRNIFFIITINVYNQILNSELCNKYIIILLL